MTTNKVEPGYAPILTQGSPHMTELREAVESSVKAYDPTTENVDEN